LKRNFWKPSLASILFAMAVGWLFLVWVPMIQRDNQIDPQKVIRDSQASIDSVRSELQEIPTLNSDKSIPRDSSDKDSPSAD
jgi:cytoskeletal protein RodZ